MSVGNGINECIIGSFRDLCSIIRYRFFFDGIVDVCSVGFLVQSGPAIRPVVGRVQINSLDFLTIAKQGNCHLGRTITILVVFIDPNLCNTDVCFFSCMSIRQCIAEVALSILCKGDILLVAFRHFSFIDSVFNCFTIFVLVEFGPLITPVVTRIECHRSADVFTVGLQLYAQFIRTDAILIAVIFPDLFD